MMLSEHLAEKISFSSLKEGACPWDWRPGAVFRIGTGWRWGHTVPHTSISVEGTDEMIVAVNLPRVVTYDVMEQIEQD